jgi:ribose transport system substrate-binding protein
VKGSIMKTTQGSRRRRLVTVIGAVWVAVILAACGGPSSAASSVPERPRVGLVMKSLSNEFFKQMQQGAQTYADKNTDKIEFKAVGMKDERDFAAQVDAVDTFVAEQFDIIVVAPADSKAMVAPLKRAVDAGITVINIDVPLDRAAMTQAGLDLPFFGPDNVEGARLAGETLAKDLGTGGKVLIIEGNPEADNAKQRKQGFEAAAAAGGLTVLGSETAHWETEEANTLMTNLLNRFPDVQGVMAANDSMALGVVKALDAAGKSGQVKVVGFDNVPTAAPLLKQGKMLATVEQHGADMAVFGIDYGIKTRAGQKFDEWVKTPIELVTAAG